VNQSGRAVKLLVQKFDIPSSNLIVIYDDLDLPVGKIRLRQTGSSGGHKGMKSIIESLGSQDFSRLRVGIGRPGETSNAKNKVIDYVLDVFTPTEEVVIKEAIAKVAEALIYFLAEDIAVAMSRYN
jgi:PTH1 family peptidyl-tRNA hydrolase